MKYLLLKTVFCFSQIFFYTGFTFYKLQKEEQSQPIFFANWESRKDLKFYDYFEMNEDTTFVLHFRDRSIPVVQSKDNIDYVRKNLLKKEDAMGTAMIDYQATWQNTIIHGHSSTSNNDMFTPLKDENYIIENEIFEIEDREGIRRLQIISYLYVDIEKDEDYYFLETSWRNTIEFSKHIQNIISLSKVSFINDIQKIKRIFTLVTCDATNNRYRYVVIAVPIEGDTYEI